MYLFLEPQDIIKGPIFHAIITSFYSQVLTPPVQLRFLLEVPAQEGLEFLGAVVSQEEELL